MATCVYNDGDFQIVFTSIRTVLRCEEEVDCQRDAPDSLKAVGDLFSTTDSTTTEVLKDFSSNLIQAIRSPLQAIPQRRPKLFKERALSTFNQLRIEKLPSVWKSLSQKIELPQVIPLQQQSVNRHLFETILVDIARSSKPTPVAAKRHLVQLSTEEDNAVRYASGFVAMKLVRKYRKMSTETAAHFVECLANMASSGDESSYYLYTLEWLTNIDRGGLFYVSDTTFSFFKAVKVKTQELLPQHLISKPKASKEKLLKDVWEDDDVQFWWSMLAIDIKNESEADELLHEIVSLWVTIGGFTVTSFWLEQYQIVQNKTVKKSKSLRKTLDKESDKT